MEILVHLSRAEIAASNRMVTGKNVAVAPRDPFLAMANRHVFSNGRAYRGRPRTLKLLLHKLAEWFMANPTVSFEPGAALFNTLAAQRCLRDGALQSDV